MSGARAAVAGTRPLRRDARENRERVLRAAATAIIRDGTQVPMATIAAEAGVGVGTLYRRYPNRELLLDALTQRSFQLLGDIADAALAQDVPSLARLAWWWDHLVAERDQLVLPLGGGPATFGPGSVAAQRVLHAKLDLLLRTGQRDGTVRADVTTRDLILFGAMLVSPPPGARDWERQARRQTRIYLRGLAASADGR